jgi:LuxR family maltose regulon positive regulatory protein
MTAQRGQKNISADRLFLERPRVEQILDRACQSHVVTVVAGEGNGKTYAVDSFLQKDPRPIIWVQISERDNLGWRFWENYTGEIARLNPEAAKIFAAVGFPETSPQFDRYLTLIKNEIISRERYVIVFDDFHLLTNPAILLFLEHTLGSPVSKNNIVLICRTEPAINTLGFLAKGFLSQVTVEDLRFSEEEVAEYFRLHHIPLQGEDLARIYHVTEGWALAVDLILQEIKAGTSGEEPSPGGSMVTEKHVWDRMMRPIRNIEEEIFSAQDRELQKFLIKLSLIEHWPRNLLEILDPEGKNISAMERISSLVRFDAYLHGFRIHHLFLDFLREKQGELSPEEVREVYAKDARWCVENSLFADAMVDYERARDYGGLLRIITSLPRMLPRTMAVYFLETLERLAGADEENEDLLFLRFIIRPRILMFLDRFDESAGESLEAIGRFESQAPGPARSRNLSAACNNLGTLTILSSRYTRDYKNYATWFERGYRYYLENPQPIQGQASQSSLGSYVLPMGVPMGPGEIEEAINYYAPAVPYASASMNGYLYGTDTLARAELAYYQGDLTRAEQFARHAVYQGREKGQYEVENRGLFYLMRICIHTGNAAGIRDLERQMEAQLEIPEYINRHTIHDITMGRFYARLGLTGKIAPWLRGEYGEGKSDALFQDFDALVKARCFFVEKDYPSALNTLEAEKARGNLGTYILGKLEMAVLEAAARFHLGEEGRALEILEEARLLAAPNSLDMPFIEMGEDMRFLAGAALARGGGGIPRPWLENIRSRASAYSKQLALTAERYAEEREQKPALYLTRRERRILAGLARGLNREDIAGETGLTLNTVKVVIRDIYAKLGAVNRADAIRIATGMGLFRD